MLTVACVKWGDLYGPDYVNKLQSMVKRNLRIPHRFVCFTDDPRFLNCETRELPKGLVGWWNKLYLFRYGLFEDRMLFLDLDVVVTGSLDELVNVPSDFCIISDWHLDSYNSSVFVLSKNAHPEVWDDFGSPGHLHGDQDWITLKIPNAPVFPAPWCVSYRSHAVIGVPKDARVVCFHGTPKPHEYPSEWVKDLWR